MALSKQKVKVILVVTGIVLIVVFAVVGSSVSTLGANEVGLDFNTVTQFINPDLFRSGRWFIGAGHEFIVFPTILQTIEFSTSSTATRGPLDAASKEGQPITIECSFQYRLRTDGDTVYQLYNTYLLNYNERFADIAQSTLKNVAAASYRTLDFFEQRRAIKREMFNALKDALSTYAIVADFQLRDISIPSDFEQAQIEKLVEAQAQRKEVIKRNATLIRAETRIIETNAQAEIDVVEQEAAGLGDLLDAEWTAMGKRVVLEAEATSYRDLAQYLDFSRPQLQYFNYLGSYNKLPHATLIVGVDQKFPSVDLN